jgi:hypothetical protein
VETRLDTARAKPLATAASAARPAPQSVTAARAMQQEAKQDLEDVAPDSVGGDIQKALKHFPGALKREKPA